MYGAPVVTVEARPVYVRVPWVPRTEVLRKVQEDVRRPHPLCVRRTEVAEATHYALPRRDVIRRGLVEPWPGPASVHLVCEPDQHALSYGPDPSCDFVDVGIVGPALDLL